MHYNYYHYRFTNKPLSLFLSFSDSVGICPLLCIVQIMIIIIIMCNYYITIWLSREGVSSQQSWFCTHVSRIKSNGWAPRIVFFAFDAKFFVLFKELFLFSIIFFILHASTGRRTRSPFLLLIIIVTHNKAVLF
jgi:hypothetical protein